MHGTDQYDAYQQCTDVTQAAAAWRLITGHGAAVQYRRCRGWRLQSILLYPASGLRPTLAYITSFLCNLTGRWRPIKSADMRASSLSRSKTARMPIIPVHNVLRSLTYSTISSTMNDGQILQTANKLHLS